MPTRGPLPRAVYWRRRLVLAGTAALLVVATVDLVDGEEDPPPAAGTAQRSAGGTAPSARPTPEGVVVGPRQGERRARNAPAPEPPPAPVPPDPVGPCADDDVVVTPVMAPAIAGRPVLVSLDLRTVESRACTWRLGPEHLAYKITTDGEDVWSSADCPGDVPTDGVVVRRDFATTYRLAWSARWSRPACPGGLGDVPPGDYEIQAASIGGEPSAVVPFTLTAPVEPEPLGPELPESAPGDRGPDRDADREPGRRQT